MINCYKSKVKKSIVIIMLTLGANAALANDVSHTEIAEALIKRYGSIEDAIIHADKLAIYEQNALQTYIVDLEYSKLQKSHENRQRLEVLAGEQKQSDLITQQELNSNPAFIKKMRELQRQKIIAQNELLHQPPESLIDAISFDPSIPQDLLLQVYPGFPGSISFFDETGAPWGIVYVKQGSSGAFVAEKTPGNAYSLEAKIPGVTNSGWFQLEGLDTTIPFRITSKNTDYVNSRRQVIIPLIGPNAKPAEYRGASSINLDEAGPEFFSFLSGSVTSVPNAREVDLVGIDGQAYYYNRFVYIRTTANLRSKGSSLVREGSIGDYNLYMLHPRSFYFFSDHGRKVKVVVKGI